MVFFFMKDLKKAVTIPLNQVYPPPPPPPPLIQCINLLDVITACNQLNMNAAWTYEKVI